jgi:hypothetical protein
VPVDVSQADGQACDTAAIRPGAVVTNEEAAANLRRDRHAAANASVSPPQGKATPMEHVLSEAETHVSDEGENLLPAREPAANGKA